MIRHKSRSWCQENRLVLQSGKSAVRLYCTVPTWSSSSDICMFPWPSVNYVSPIPKSGLDLHDLHELRSRFLLFIHDLLQSLRSSGVRLSISTVLLDALTMSAGCSVVLSYAIELPALSCVCAPTWLRNFSSHSLCGRHVDEYWIQKEVGVLTFDLLQNSDVQVLEATFCLRS
jgi:hypothetical protein